MTNVININVTGLDEDSIFDVLEARRYADNLRYMNDMVVEKLRELARDNAALLHGTPRGKLLEDAINSLEAISREANIVARDLNGVVS